MGRYIDLDQLKVYCANDMDTEDDAFLEAALLAAESWIDQFCARRFDVAVAATARKFAVPEDDDGDELLPIDDCTSVTSVVNDGVTITGYELDPINGIDASGLAVPYTGIWLTSGAWMASSSSRFPVTVTATWGWPAIPDAVTQAALVLARDQVLARRSFGSGYVAVTSDLGLRAGENRQVTSMLAKFRRAEAWGIA